jgi:hypothetical protein
LQLGKQSEHVVIDVDSDNRAVAHVVSMRRLFPGDVALEEDVGALCCAGHGCSWRHRDEQEEKTG